MSERPPLIAVENVAFSYGSQTEQALPALSGIDLTIRHGEFTGLVGQNGSGKTTLARHLNGLLKPDVGKVLVSGQDTREVETGHLAGTVGYVFQNPDHALFLPTVHEEVAYSLQFQGLSDEEQHARIERALAAFGLEDLAALHPASFGRGTRRLVVLAAVYAMEPDLLVLDEPTGGLDHRLTTGLVTTLEEFVAKGGSVLLISHDMQLIANTCRRVLALSSGKLLADCAPAELFRNRDILAESGLQPPPIAELVQSLDDTGIDQETISIAGVARQYRRTGRNPQ